METHTSVSQGGDAPATDIKSGAKTQPIGWTYVAKGRATAGDLSALCTVGVFDPAHPVFGYVYHLIGISFDGKITESYRCIPFTDLSKPPPPPPVPVLPTIEEVWAHAQLPTPVIGLDPATRGVTGLDTRIWTESGTNLSISVSLDGYGVTGTATVVGYTVQLDDDPTIHTDSAGDASNPIAHHVFETKGNHRVKIGVMWHGVATFSGPDLAQPVTVSIGDATITATRTYRVTEIRSVLQP